MDPLSTTQDRTSDKSRGVQTPGPSLWIRTCKCCCQYFSSQIFIPPRKRSLGGGYIGITLSVCPSVQSKLNLDNNFFTKGDRALILHKCIPCDKTFLSIQNFLTLWSWPWLLPYFWKNLTLAITFKPREIGLSCFTWLCISCGKTFLLETKFFTMWPWPWFLTYFWKT